MLDNILTAREVTILNSILQRTGSAVVCCHTNPDGDAVGSCLGLSEWLRHRGVQATVIVPDMFPDFLQWLPGTEKIIRYDKHAGEADRLLSSADTIFCLDFNDYRRTERMEESLTSTIAARAGAVHVVMIDHHPNPQINCTLRVSMPEMSSTSELVFRIVWQMGDYEAMTSHFAAPVYCGMMTDTGGFTYNSSSPAIFFIISELLTKGIDKDRIYRAVYHTFSENRLRMTGYVLYHKLMVFPKAHASLFTITRAEQKRFHFMKGDAEGLVNLPLMMKGHLLSISLREDTERAGLILVSLRSVGPHPCNTIAEQFFNGGGHENAAGGRLYCSIDDAVEVAKRAINAFANMSP